MNSISTTNPFIVLVADNMSDDVESVVNHLKECGHNLVFAKNDEDVLKQAESILPGIILLDTLIPANGGFETCRRLKENKATKDIPVIFISSSKQPENKVEAFEAGGVDYITKPFQVEEVLARIKTHITLHKMRKQLEAQNSQLQREIAEREQTQASLKYEQSLLNAVMENIPDHVCCKDLQGRFTRVNQAMADWFGVSDPTKVLGKTDFDFFTSEHAQKTFADEQKIICTGQPLENEEEKETWYDGRETWVLTTKIPLQNQDGEIIGTMGISRDITARKQAGEELRKYKEHLEEEVEKRTAEIAHLYAKEQASRKLAEQLQASAQVVNSSLDLNVVLPTILDQLREVIYYDGASVQLVEGDAMRVLAVRGYPESEIGRVRSFADYPYNLRLGSNPEPIIVEETSKEKLWTSNFEYSDIRSNIGVPLIVRNRIIGTLTIDSHKPAQYTHEDMQTVLVFAGQAAIAIENAQLYSSAQQELYERTRTEEVLRKSQRDYADLINSIDGIVWEANADTFEFTFVSPQAEQMLGYSVEHWLAEPNFWSERIYPEDREWAVNFCVQATKEKRDHEFLYRMMTLDGRVVWLHDFVTVIVENNKAVKLRGVMVDVTESKKAEAALRESEEMLNVIVEDAPDSIIVVDDNGRIQRVNAQVERTFGYTQEELLDQSIETLVSDHLRQTHEKMRADYLTAPRLRPMGKGIELYGMHKDGSEIPLEVMLSPVNIDSVRLAVAVARDITERKEAEAALRASEARYRGLFQYSPISLWEEDFSEVKKYIDSLRPEGVEDLRAYFTEHPEAVVRCSQLAKVLQVNETTLRLVESSSEKELLGGLEPTFNEKSFEGFCEEILALAEGNLTFEIESEIVSLKGKKIAVHITLSVLPGYEESWSKVLVSVTDLTARKRAEEALRESEIQLRQSQKMEAIGRLAGGIAHDFNNMLLPVIGYSDMLLGKLHDEDPLYHQIEEIKKAGERAAALTKQILAFSRKSVLQPQVLDLNEIVFDIDRMLERLIGEHIELKIKLHPALWSVKVDPNQIEQVIVNLAVNARDAMPEGGNLTIETSNVFLDEEYAKNHLAVPSGNYVILAVSDTGRGMDDETKSHIFEPFFTTKERGKGTGLGLSTVYGIIKQSGGNVWVYSELGHGTTFKIYLPCVEEAPQALKSVTVYETNQGTETILIVEDEESVRNVLEIILSSCGYNVLPSASGKKALEICDSYKEPIHLLITDVVLPQMGGREVAERVTAARPEIKVLYISGYTENSVVHHGMVLDPDIPFLQKPFSANILLQKVQEVLNTNRNK